MSDFFNSEIVQWVLATLIGMLILGILGWLQFKLSECAFGLKLVAEEIARVVLEERLVSIPDLFRNSATIFSSRLNCSQPNIPRISIPISVARTH